MDALGYDDIGERKEKTYNSNNAIEIKSLVS